MLKAELAGLLAPDFVGERAPPIVYDAAPDAQSLPRQMVEVHDARALQSDATSESAFFAQHGFVLLPHISAVRDWDREIVSIYQREIDSIVRDRLLPGNRVETYQVPQVIRRGGGRRYYIEFIHSDGPLTSDLYAQNVDAMGSGAAGQVWRSRYEQDDVAGMVSIGFWRTVNMRAPLRHLPLAFCDPSSIDRADIFPTTMVGAAPQRRPTHHVALRFNPSQQWYYYPDVTGSEVIAFKLCQFWKDDPDAPPQNVFHGAFRDPTVPEDTEPRQSCEHRASVFILRD